MGLGAAVFCPRLSDLCPLFFDIVDRNATGFLPALSSFWAWLSFEGLARGAGGGWKARRVKMSAELSIEAWLALSGGLLSVCGGGLRIKRVRAFGGCLGTERRRRTWHAAKSRGEGRAPFDPRISEWGNPALLGHRLLNP
jgi:hypothetical protein